VSFQGWREWLGREDVQSETCVKIEGGRYRKLNSGEGYLPCPDPCRLEMGVI